MENKKGIWKILNKLKSLFFSGLFALIPISITIFFLHFAFHTFTGWLSPLKKIEPTFLQQIPGFEFILIIAFVILFGIVSKFLIIGPIVHHFEKVISKIPIIRTIYSASKTLVDFFNVKSKEDKIQRKVVLIKFPTKYTFNIAFILGSAKNTFQTVIPPHLQTLEDDNDEYVKVFMPHSPNPSTGYFFIIPKSQTIETKITFEEAIKTVVSCGLITPESLKNLEIEK
ncbi:TPA: hypothetical protein DEO28_04120 [Candidatus Dependentiae bacterium]|nr:MAG: hypothetical protein UR14_C0006G0061 [candidate division TM6 bacterium GW2011_GWE2_31_21]KKP53516.1 MAG: hypothetical protein UR43_C0004G0057 [candidate division TM6 bacterium GW2011_GWF2_33_332]HBS48243.1 hypothetical protein [Candidatus Dependentiae bacterium]HBZ73669.1 hypothetical protein [Candidatus Dependentiae bacterium]